MLCPHCRQARLALTPSCQDLTVVCPGCGHIFPTEEVAALIERRRRTAPDCRKSGLPPEEDLG